jgi:hypothetical protein
MYPIEDQFKVDVIGTLGDAVKQAFEIFNEVKGMLPEGSMEKLGLPGSLPDDIPEKVDKGVKMFNQAKDAFTAISGALGGGKQAEEFEDFEELMAFDEEENVTELFKFMGGESNASFAERKKVQA